MSFFHFQHTDRAIRRRNNGRELGFFFRKKRVEIFIVPSVYWIGKNEQYINIIIVDTGNLHFHINFYFSENALLYGTLHVYRKVNTVNVERKKT